MMPRAPRPIDAEAVRRTASFADWVETLPRWVQALVWVGFTLLMAAWFLPPLIGLMMVN